MTPMKVHVKLIQQDLLAKETRIIADTDALLKGNRLSYFEETSTVMIFLFWKMRLFCSGGEIFLPLPGFPIWAMAQVRFLRHMA